MYTFAPLLSSVLARIRPRPEPPVVDDFSYWSMVIVFLMNSDTPPVTTATRPATSYKSCLLYLEAIVKALQWTFQLPCCARERNERMYVNESEIQVGVLRLRWVDISKESICNVTCNNVAIPMQVAVTFPAIWLESRPIRIHNSSPAFQVEPRARSRTLFPSPDRHSNAINSTQSHIGISKVKFPCER
jgi:hypothetical protein